MREISARPDLGVEDQSEHDRLLAYVLDRINRPDRLVYLALRRFAGEAGTYSALAPEINAPRLAAACGLTANNVRTAKQRLTFQYRLIEPIILEVFPNGAYTTEYGSPHRFVTLTQDHPALRWVHGRRPRNHEGDGLTMLYRWFDADGLLLYVGITSNIYDRQAAHESQSEWFQFAASATVEVFPTRTLAELSEREAIETGRPLFNGTYNYAVPQSARDEYLARALAMTPG